MSSGETVAIVIIAIPILSFIYVFFYSWCKYLRETAEEEEKNRKQRILLRRIMEKHRKKNTDGKCTHVWGRSVHIGYNDYAARCDLCGSVSYRTDIDGFPAGIIGDNLEECIDKMQEFRRQKYETANPEGTKRAILRSLQTSDFESVQEFPQGEPTRL